MTLGLHTVLFGLSGLPPFHRVPSGLLHHILSSSGSFFCPLVFPFPCLFLFFSLLHRLLCLFAFLPFPEESSASSFVTDCDFDRHLSFFPFDFDPNPAYQPTQATASQLASHACPNKEPLFLAGWGWGGESGAEEWSSPGRGKHLFWCFGVRHYGGVVAAAGGME